MRPLIDAGRSATTRLIMIYGGLFALWCVALLGVVQWEASTYLTGVIDQLLVQRMNYLVTTEPQRLSATVDAAAAMDPGRLMWAGLFDADGKAVAGNIVHLPPGLQPDDAIHSLDEPAMHAGIGEFLRARALAVRLPSGQLLVLAKTTSTIDGLGAIIRRGLLWGLSLTLIPGLLGGILLSRGPARRIRQIQLATEPVRRGDLTGRLPVSRRGDELDLLAGIVNTMLDEIERLMGEVKGVCDNIAHDLRTPLTRLRARLYRAQQQLDGAPQAKLIESSLADIDSLLARFRALLRISELEDRKRSVCFSQVDLKSVLAQVHEFYAPLAEDRGQHFELDVPTLAPLRADPHLLFEAFANLVGNAIKFTPEGGWVRIRAQAEAGGLRVDVLDSGPGIPLGEREAVKRRFYRGDSSRSTAGSGLGLSIVSAIAGLHGYSLEIGENAAGARITLHCHNRSSESDMPVTEPTVVVAERLLPVDTATLVDS
ncbi:MAG: HAMP domain-containing sensor histidine kinase [Dyella sp.]